MASIGHVAVGLAAARLYHGRRPPSAGSLAAWSAVSLLPDADVIGFALGVDYSDPWGHRGATHSLLFAVAVGTAIALVARRFKRPFVRTALFASLLVASHALLDTMTDGGLGCALWWPFDDARYFAPWRPIPVAPIGLGFLSPGGAAVALVELILFAPLLLLAWPTRRVPVSRPLTGVVLVCWALTAWLIVSGDRVRDAILGRILREDTAYASGFSESAFRTIAPGHSDRDVRRLLGAPIAESWLYTSAAQPAGAASEQSAAARSRQCFAIRFEAGRVLSVRDADACRAAGITTGMSIAEVDGRLGTPPERCWQYSRSPGGARHRLRMICFTNATVTTVIRRWE